MYIYDKKWALWPCLSPAAPTFPLVIFSAACQYVVMLCIICHSDSRVINSRHNKRHNQIWRRRQCRNCSQIWTSYEIADYSTLATVQGVPFSRDKLFLSILASCRHRSDAITDAAAVTDTIIRNALKTGSLELKTAILSQISYKVLQRFDKAAATHYRAFHKLS